MAEASIVPLTQERMYPCWVFLRPHNWKHERISPSQCFEVAISEMDVVINFSQERVDLKGWVYVSYLTASM